MKYSPRLWWNITRVELSDRHQLSHGPLVGEHWFRLLFVRPSQHLRCLELGGEEEIEIYLSAAGTTECELLHLERRCKCQPKALQVPFTWYETLPGLKKKSRSFYVREMIYWACQVRSFSLLMQGSVSESVRTGSSGTQMFGHPLACVNTSDGWVSPTQAQQRLTALNSKLSWFFEHIKLPEDTCTRS
jgi:hypothetical protein